MTIASIKGIEGNISRGCIASYRHALPSTATGTTRVPPDAFVCAAAQTRGGFGCSLPVFFRFAGMHAYCGCGTFFHNRRNDHDDKESMGCLERRHQGWRRHDLHRNRRAQGSPLRFQVTIRERQGHQSGGTHRRRACRLLLDGAFPDTGEAGLTAEKIETHADVTLDKVGEGFEITASHLNVKAKIPGADKAKFEEIANKAKAGCPVSKLMKATITMDAALQS